MTDPDWPYELRLSSPEARFFQLYSPSHGGIFVAEPVTHANAALNEPESEWPELGMKGAGSGAVDEPRHAAGRHSEIAAPFRLNSGEAPYIAARSAALGDVGEWLKPAVC